MATPITQSAFLKQFVCLGDKCEDTCCKGWGMQLDAGTKQKYEKEAPELLAAVSTGEAEHIMKRDPKTDYCVKFEDGWCGIHKKYGADFLGDACYFYPRITRALGDKPLMTAALSCPETARLMLFGDSPFAFAQGEAERLPRSLKDYLPQGMSQEDAYAVHLVFLKATEGSDTPERIMAHIISVSHSLKHLPMSNWPKAVPFYFKQADARLPMPEFNPADAFNLLHAVAGLVAASPKSHRPRLEETLREMQTALGAQIDWATMTIQLSATSAQALAQASAVYRQQAKALAPVLKRWIGAELSMAMFPFSGFGRDVAERASLMGLRFAIVKLAITCSCVIAKDALPKDVIVRVVQSLSRFLDHLADPALTLQICEETGWLRESRMRALMGDG